MDLDNWLIAQTADPCLNTLSAGTGSAVVIDYSSTTVSEGISPASGSSTWDPDAFFGNTDTANCPITSCQILAPGCSGSYSGTNNLVVSHTAIVATKNVASGYS